MTLGEERCWTASTEGDENFQWRKNNKKELGREECERQGSLEEACDADTFCSICVENVTNSTRARALLIRRRKGLRMDRCWMS